MEFFPSGSGFQFYDSHFYNIAGDMNVHGAQLAAIERELAPNPFGWEPMALSDPFGSTQSLDQSHAFHGGESPLGANIVGSHMTVPREFRRDESTTNFSGGTFLLGGNVNHIQRHGESGLHILYDAAANDASHDSGERYPQPKCHPETRTEILENLHSWSLQADPRSSVLWLHGPAGAGKSAIAQSFCQKLEAEGRLGGSFFFKRLHPSRGNGNKLFPTIAYQLALLLPELKRVITERVEDDPSIIHKSLSIQLQRLIMEPCRDTGTPSHTIVIIDGLDECGGQNVQQEILRAIGGTVCEQQLPLRVFIASRPEPHIRDVFREPCLAGLHWPFNLQRSFNDVRTYLHDEFTRIHREHRQTMATVTTPWPSKEVIEHLVKKSSGYFIYASTVIKYIDDKYFRPTDRLEIIMGFTEVEPDSGSPFEALDQLYTQILAAVPARRQLVRILTVIAADLKILLSSIEYLEHLLDLKPGDVLLALRGVHSVINVEEDKDTEKDDEEYQVWVHHASFLDFLHDPTRSGVFHVGNCNRTHLARDILKKLAYTYNDPTANRKGHVAW
ncbi:hypothetical protein B0H13DRAFT_2568509 [Mycena leptocephala]|nr:hypothetical protein B0H13DRAFT_2568509 [Mycena leptocephala]